MLHASLMHEVIRDLCGEALAFAYIYLIHRILSICLDRITAALPCPRLQIPQQPSAGENDMMIERQFATSLFISKRLFEYMRLC